MQTTYINHLASGNSSEFLSNDTLTRPCRNLTMRNPLINICKFKHHYLYSSLHRVNFHSTFFLHKSTLITLQLGYFQTFNYSRLIYEDESNKLSTGLACDRRCCANTHLNRLKSAYTRVCSASLTICKEKHELVQSMAL